MQCRAVVATGWGVCRLVAGVVPGLGGPAHPLAVALIPPPDFLPTSDLSHTKSMPINLDMTCISAIKEATLLELRQQGIYPSYHDFDIVKSYFTDSLEARIVSYFRSEKVVEESHTVSVRTPATWWDAFKAAHFPAWLLARYPVKFEIKSETVLFTQKAVYPEFAKHFADSGGSVYCIEIEKQLLNSSPNYTHA